MNLTALRRILSAEGLVGSVDGPLIRGGTKEEAAKLHVRVREALRRAGLERGKESPSNWSRHGVDVKLGTTGDPVTGEFLYHVAVYPHGSRFRAEVPRVLREAGFEVVEDFLTLKIYP